MFVLILAVATITAALWYLLMRPYSFWDRLGVKQSKPWIIVGDSWRTLFARMSFSDNVNSLYNIHPGERYIGVYNFSKPVLLVRDPELIKQMTVKDFEHFTDHNPFVDPDSDPLWSNALLSLKGERWKEMRNVLSPTFTSAKIKSLYVLMLETAENFVNHFLEKDDAIIDLEMKDVFSRFTNDIIATTAFGVEVNSLKDRNNVFFEMGKRLTDFVAGFKIIKFMGHQVFPKLFKALDVPFLDRDASKYFSEVIENTIKARDEQKIVRSDMLQLMLEARNQGQANEVSNAGKPKRSIAITDVEITAQAMIFFFAGFDTISTTMSFGSYELALNKKIQDKLRKEIYETQRNGKVTYDVLMQMKYLDMVISETLRKWPPFPLTDRLCTKPYTIKPVNKDEKPLQISVNQEIWIPFYGIQNDPKYFPNPEKFDPERFSDENKHNILPYTFLSFGVGPRNCIGNRFALLEMKALMFNLLLHYEILPTEKTPIPMVLSNTFSQIPVGGLWLSLKRIKN